jgi:hypothetical protein
MGAARIASTASTAEGKLRLAPATVGARHIKHHRVERSVLERRPNHGRQTPAGAKHPVQGRERTRKVHEHEHVARENGVERARCEIETRRVHLLDALPCDPAHSVRCRFDHRRRLVHVARRSHARRAAMSATSPVPVPISRTRIPSAIRASTNIRSVAAARMRVRASEAFTQAAAISRLPQPVFVIAPSRGLLPRC